MIKHLMLLFLGITTFIISSCKSRYSQYHADWIVKKAEYEGENVYDLITLFNFKINVQSNTARPAKIDFTNEFTLSRDVPIEFSRKNGKDYLKILDHPTLKGVFEIDCLDKNCCTISIQNEKIYLELTYNSEIPYGVERDCP